MTFTIPKNEYKCRFCSIYIENRTRYIQCGTIIFWGTKTFLVSEYIPDYTERLGDLVVKCKVTNFDPNYYDVLYIEADGKKYKYKKVSID